MLRCRLVVHGAYDLGCGSPWCNGIRLRNKVILFTAPDLALDSYGGSRRTFIFEARHLLSGFRERRWYFRPGRSFYRHVMMLSINLLTVPAICVPCANSRDSRVRAIVVNAFFMLTLNNGSRLITLSLEDFFHPFSSLSAWFGAVPVWQPVIPKAPFD